MYNAAVRLFSFCSHELCNSELTIEPDSVSKRARTTTYLTPEKSLNIREPTFVLRSSSGVSATLNAVESLALGGEKTLTS